MRKRAIILFIFAVMLLSGSLVLAKTVIVAGIGSTDSEAESDAIRNAVERSVGVLVDTKTLAEKKMVLNEQIYSRSKGFIRSYMIIDKLHSMKNWAVTIEADIDDSPGSKLMNELIRLGIIDVQLCNPKIAVYIPERRLCCRISDPVTEAAVAKVFKDAGFTNIIQASSALKRANVSSCGWSLKSFHNISTEEMQNVARFFNADLLIIGEALSEGMYNNDRDLPGLQVANAFSCKVRVDGKMYIAKNGQTLATNSIFASSTDVSEPVALKKALVASGQQLGAYFVKIILAQSPGCQGID